MKLFVGTVIADKFSYEVIGISTGVDTVVRPSSLAASSSTSVSSLRSHAASFAVHRPPLRSDHPVVIGELLMMPWRGSTRKEWISSLLNFMPADTHPLSRGSRATVSTRGNDSPPPPLESPYQSSPSQWSNWREFRLSSRRKSTGRSTTIYRTCDQYLSSWASIGLKPSTLLGHGWPGRSTEARDRLDSPDPCDCTSSASCLGSRPPYLQADHCTLSG